MRDEQVQTTRVTYDRIADAYAQANEQLPDSVLESIKRFLDQLPRGALVADVGCGPGRDLLALRERGLRVVGFDLSFGMLTAGGRSAVVQADMTAPWPVRTETFDGIWCAAALLHVPRDLVSATLGHFAGALRAGGSLHLSVAEGRGEAMERDPYLASGDRWFVLHEEQSLSNCLAAQGLRVVATHRSESRRRWLTLDAIRESMPTAG